jgi:exopolysaccharide biosynthesis polyprenyl glycosylphosphotransferase
MRYPKYKYFFAIVDLMILASSFVLSKIIYNYIRTPHIPFYVGIDSYDLLFIFFVCVFFVFIFQYYNLYKFNVFLTRALQLILLIKSIFYGSFIIVVLTFFIRSEIITDSRLFLILFWIISIFLFLLVRVLLIQHIYENYLAKLIFKRKIIIIGGGKAGKLFAEKLYEETVYGIKILGFIDDNIPLNTEIFRNFKIIGKTSDLKEIKSRFDFDEIAICIDNIEHEKLLTIIDECLQLKLEVKVTSELFDVIPEKLNTEKYSGLPVVNFTQTINWSIYFVFKRIIDYIGAIIGLIILFPFFFITSILIKTSSKGPVIFKQNRIGKYGKPFKFYKFRTMTVLEGEDTQREKVMKQFMKSEVTGKKIVNEKRITKIGRFLRKYSLDELPQLFNVIKGDMSLVGPRPCLTYEFNNYDEWQKRRLDILPGCTGLWQVSARSEVSFSDSVLIDIYYINNVTPWLDLQLLFKTIPVMIFAKGGK